MEVVWNSEVDAALQTKKKKPGEFEFDWVWYYSEEPRKGFCPPKNDDDSDSDLHLDWVFETDWTNQVP